MRLEVGGVDGTAVVVPGDQERRGLHGGGRAGSGPGGLGADKMVGSSGSGRIDC